MPVLQTTVRGERFRLSGVGMVSGMKCRRAKGPILPDSGLGRSKEAGPETVPQNRGERGASAPLFLFPELVDRRQGADAPPSPRRRSAMLTSA